MMILFEDDYILEKLGVGACENDFPWRCPHSILTQVQIFPIRWGYGLCFARGPAIPYFLAPVTKGPLISY